jgi:diguanylate cyclase (GGDEF)-like protein
MKSDQIKVLLIEDNSDDVRLIQRLLAQVNLDGFKLTHANGVDKAVRELQRKAYDVVLTDIAMTDSDALETIRRIQSVRKDIPIVILTSHDDESTAIEIMQEGAQDYLIKGQGDGHLIARALRHAIERKHAELRLMHVTHYDSLTGLANRALFQNRLDHALAVAKRRKHLAALLVLDLDRFKGINDTLGHHAGDQLLVLVAERLRGCVRESDTVARLGGDEFTVILNDVTSAEEVAVVARKVLAALAVSFLLEGHEVYVTPSIGITLYPHDGVTSTGLLKNADAAMYQAKSQGRNNFQFYTADLNRRSVARLKLESGLRQAIDRSEFVLYYQPKIDIKTGTLTGVEAMVRWNKPDTGLVPPVEFIPIAEETGLIIPVGEWVLREALMQIGRWQEEGLPQMRIAVNLSARQFRQNDLVKTITDSLDELGVGGEFLEVEITESLLMDDTALSTMALYKLKDRGVRVSVDDFGTGYSSLSYLKRFPIDALKIDRSFVRDITTDPDDATITNAIIGLAHNLRRRVIAEGVETQAQLAFLQKHGCDEAQGFLFSPPVAATELARLLGAPGGLAAMALPGGKKGGSRLAV